MSDLGILIRNLSAAGLAAFLLLTATPAQAQPFGVERERALILQALATDNSPQTRQLAERVRASRDLPRPLVSEVLQSFADAGHYPQVYGLIEAVVAPRLIGADKDESREWLNWIGAIQSGPERGAGTARWQTVPEVAAAWPSLALAINRHLLSIDGRGGRFADAMARLPNRDFREDPEVTRFLAAAGYPPVMEWAVRELERPSPLLPPLNDPGRRAALAAREAHERRMMLPLAVLVLGQSNDREEVLDRVFCQTLGRRDGLFLAFEEFGSPEDVFLIQRYAHLAEVNGRYRPSIGLALHGMHTRDDWQFDNVTKVYEAFIKGEDIAENALRCPAPAPE